MATLIDPETGLPIIRKPLVPLPEEPDPVTTPGGQPIDPVQPPPTLIPAPIVNPVVAPQHPLNTPAPAPVVDPVVKPNHPLNTPAPAPLPPPRRRGVEPPIYQPPPHITPTPARLTRQTARTPRKIQINQSAAGQIIDVIFGKAPQGLKTIYANSFTNGNVLYIVAGIGEGPLHSITPKINGKAMVFNAGLGYWIDSSLKIHAWVYDGSQTSFQETASGLSALDSTWITNAAAPLNVYDNLAYVVFQITFDADKMTDVPTITFDILGYSDLYDARTSTRGYSDNTSLVIRELLTNQRWGLRVPTANMDDSTFSTAATNCDLQVFPIVGAAPTVAIGSAGVVTGTFKYAYSVLNSFGVETLVSAVSGSIVPSAKQVGVTIPAGDSLTSSRNVYRSGNNDFTVYRLVGSLAGNSGGTFTDNMSVATWGSQTLAPTIAPYTYKYSSFNMTCSQQSSGDNWLQTLRAHCLGVISFEAGNYQLFIDQAVAGGYVRQQFSENYNYGGNNEKANVDPLSIKWGRKKRADTFNEVEVRYNDAQNNYTPSSLVVSRASVTSGAEMPRRAVYELGGLPDSSMAGRIAANLLNLEWDDATFTWNADRSALKTKVWDVVQLTGNGLSKQDVRVRSIVGNGEGFTIAGTEYHDASYSNSVLAAYAPLSTGTTGGLPTQTPPDVTALTASVGVFSRASVYWTAPASYNFVREYRVYKSDVTGTTKVLYSTIPAAAIPTSALPLDIDAFATHTLNRLGGGGTATVYVIVTVVSQWGIESTGVFQSASSSISPSGTYSDTWVAQSEQAVALVNGLNSNIAGIGSGGPGHISLSGPTAAFSVGGFGSLGSTATGGVFLTAYYSGSQVLTIVNEDASSTSAARIKTLTGANVVLQGPCEFTLVYNSDASRWVLVDPTLTAQTQTAGDSSTKLATTAFVATSFETIAAAAATYAPLASPALTGNPTAPTQAGGDNSTKLATTAFVATSFAPLASPALTGNPTAPTQSPGDSSTKLATTAFVATSFAPLASPALTGSPTAPTQTAGDNSTKIATTAYVDAAKLNHAITSADFTKTSNTTLADITGLSLTVAAGATVAFRAELLVTLDTAGFGKIAIAGTCTATAIRYDALYLDQTAADTAFLGGTTTKGTALSVAAVSGGASGHITITGFITVNAGGTLTVQFAQAVSSAGGSAVRRGSHFWLI